MPAFSFTPEPDEADSWQVAGCDSLSFFGRSGVICEERFPFLANLVSSVKREGRFCTDCMFFNVFFPYLLIPLGVCPGRPSPVWRARPGAVMKPETSMFHPATVGAASDLRITPPLTSLAVVVAAGGGPAARHRSS